MVASQTYSPPDVPTIEPAVCCPRRRPLRRSVAVLGLMLVSACSYHVRWREMDLGPVAFEDAWSAVERSVEVDGFRTDVGSSDRGLRRYQTQWRSRVGMGFGPGARSSRTRVLAEFDALDTEGWRLRYCVEQQQVTDMEKSMDPGADDWKTVGQDQRMEERLTAKLRLHFGKPLVEDSDVRQ